MTAVELHAEGTSSCAPGTRRWVCRTACAPPRRAEPRPCRPASAPAALHCHQSNKWKQCHVHAGLHQPQQPCIAARVTNYHSATFMQACISPSSPSLPPTAHCDTVPHPCSTVQHQLQQADSTHKHHTSRAMSMWAFVWPVALHCHWSGASVTLPIRPSTVCDAQAAKPLCAGAGAPLQDMLDRGRAQAFWCIYMSVHVLPSGPPAASTRRS